MQIETRNPWTGAVEYRYAMQDRAAVEAVLASARRAAEAGLIPAAVPVDFVD